MKILLTIILIVLFALLGGVVYLLYRFIGQKNKNDSSKDDLNDKLFNFERNILEQVNKSFDTVQFKMEQKLEKIDQKVNDNLSHNFSQTNKTYEDVITRLTKIDEAQKNLDKLSTSVTSLTNVLDNNQNRGKFGEFTLERILFSVFGDSKNGVYELQYPLKSQGSNERPDAVIFLPEPQNLICIDSKFPYQDYKRLIETKDESYKLEFAKAIKIHINAVASKYIISGETAPTAMMFIPSDAIFGFINGELYDIVEYARNKNVTIVSPSTLQPILANINMIRIDYIKSQNVEIINEQLKKLAVDFQKFNDDWFRFSKDINQTLNAKEEFDRRTSLLNKRFQKIVKMENSSDTEKEEA